MSDSSLRTFTTRPVTDADHAEVERLVLATWGSPIMMSRGKVFNILDLPGFIAEADGQTVGLITYSIIGDECEIGSLNSLKEGLGVGTALMREVTKVARGQGCRRVWLVTTNDNLRALGFYQKRGYSLVAVRRNSMNEVRKIKPEVPMIGLNGIPLRDEIELEMLLDGNAGDSAEIR